MNEAVIFCFNSFSLNMLAPRNTLKTVDSWNRASAYATLIFEKTKFVEYCIVATNNIRNINSLKLWSLNFNFDFMRKSDENNKPDIAQRINEVGMLVSRIIFFMKTASVPEKIRASTLYAIAFLLPIPLSYKRYVPVIIKNIPKIAVRAGISFKYKYAAIIAARGLYELIGAREDNSPIERALIIK